MKYHISRSKAAVICLVIGELLLAILGCAPKVQVVPPPEPMYGPTIRLGIVQNADQISFSCPGGFKVVDDSSKIIFSSGSGGLDWKVRVKFGQPASEIYRIVLYEEKEMVRAMQREDDLRNLGFQPKILEVGRELWLGTRLINDNRKYWVTVGPYATEEEAYSEKEKMTSGTMHLVIPEILSPPLGVLDLVSPFGRVVLSSGEPFSLVPSALREGQFTLYGVPVGQGFSWARQEDRSYRGKMEFRIGNDGKLLAINEISMENYLKGVLPSEMSPGFPMQALRAQAITARSHAIAKLGFRHRLDPFDLCAGVHCQAYSGTGKEHPTTSQAVDETRGQVLVYGGEVCDAVYSAICGGYTENSSNVWSGPPVAYLTGIPDASNEESTSLPVSLESEEEVRAWVLDEPPVFCNHLCEDASVSVLYAQKYFRWDVKYSAKELEKIVVQKTGQQIGNLLDIIALRRGRSGRLMQIRIDGDAVETTVQGELKIRRALSPNYLPSACFVVDKEIGSDGLPDSFIFHGAGWGHGVGMCQVGAAGMAIEGFDHREILLHYYQGAEVIQIYEAFF